MSTPQPMVEEIQKPKTLNLEITSSLLEQLEVAERCRVAYEVVYEEGFSDYRRAEVLLLELKEARSELGRRLLFVYECQMKSITEPSL